MLPTQPQISNPPNNLVLSEISSSAQPNGQQPTPPTSPNDQQSTTTRELPNWHHEVVPEEDQTFFKEMREGIMIVAILAAGSTYQAGLNPPGSFWQDDSKDHRPGDPILHDTFIRRYTAFFYFNAISFLSSLVIIIFLMNKNFYREKAKIKALQITMVLDLFSFMAAYAVGSCRRVSTSMYIFLIMGGVFLYVLWLVRLYPLLRNIVRRMPCAWLWERTAQQTTRRVEPGS